MQLDPLRHPLQDITEPSHDTSLKYVKENGYALQYIKKQTPELCKAAIDNISHAVKYVKDQTYELCMRAIVKNGLALRHIKDQTVDMCLAAVSNNGRALEYAQYKTEEICYIAVEECSYALAYVDIQTPDMCLLATTLDGVTLKYVKEQTPEICMAAVKQNGHALQYVKDQTHEICMAAIFSDSLAIQYVIDQSHELCMLAVTRNGLSLEYIPDQTTEICKAAIANDENALKYVKDQTYDICVYAFSIAIEGDIVLSHVREQTLELCEAAINNAFGNDYESAIRDKDMYAKCEHLRRKKRLDFKERLQNEEQTPELCMLAIRYDPKLINYINEDIPEIVLAYSKSIDNLWEQITDHPVPDDMLHEVMLAIVKHTGRQIIMYGGTNMRPNHETCMYAVREDIEALEGIYHLDDDGYEEELSSYKLYRYDICLEGTKYNPGGGLDYTCNYIKKYCTHELAMLAITHDPMDLEDIPKEYRTNELCVTAVKLNKNAIEYVLDITPEVIEAYNSS